MLLGYASGNFFLARSRIISISASFIDSRQRMDSPGFLAGAVGEGSHHRFPSAESLGGLSAADVHDAGCGGGGGGPGRRMASVGAHRPSPPNKSQTPRP